MVDVIHALSYDSVWECCILHVGLWIACFSVEVWWKQSVKENRAENMKSCTDTSEHERAPIRNNSIITIFSVNQTACNSTTLQLCSSRDEYLASKNTSNYILKSLQTLWSTGTINERTCRPVLFCCFGWQSSWMSAGCSCATDWRWKARYQINANISPTCPKAQLSPSRANSRAD